MILTNKTKKELSELGYSIEEAQNMTREEFIAKYSNASKKLAICCDKLKQYKDGEIGEVKRNKIFDIYDSDMNLLANKKKFNLSVVKIYIVILDFTNKYGKDNNVYSLPIEKINFLAGTTNMIAKKAINTLLKYNIIEFVGYTRKYSKYAECQFRVLNLEELNKIVQFGKELWELDKEIIEEVKDENKSEIIEKKVVSTINISSENKLYKRLKKSVIAMKECPTILEKFIESNIYTDEFKQSFLLDGKLRASSHFAATKNPDHVEDKSCSERLKMLTKLEDMTGCKYVESDLTASIYTLSYYLDHDAFPNYDFYKLFDETVKKEYGNTNYESFNTIGRKLVKVICMSTYMRGYNIDWKAQKAIHDASSYSRMIYEYFVGHSIEEDVENNNYLIIYKKFYSTLYTIMNTFFNIQKSKIFLYESMLCSILISLASSEGVQVVNVYDGFYVPESYKGRFETEFIPRAYKEVKSIYDKSKLQSTREKNKILLDYLDSIGKLIIIDGRKYIKMMDDTIYIDFYNYKLIHSIDHKINQINQVA